MRNFGGRDRGPAGGRGDRSFGSRDRFDKPLFKATCASCGESCEVPFRPNGSKPVYCRNCFKKEEGSFGGSTGRREERGGFDRGSRDSGFPEKRMFDATCNDCGNDCQVPFRPTGEKPVYCRNCFSKHLPDTRGSREPMVRTLQSDYSEQFRSLNAKLDTLITLLTPGSAAPAKAEKAVVKEVGSIDLGAAPKAAKKKVVAKKKK